MLEVSNSKEQLNSGSWLTRVMKKKKCESHSVMSNSLWPHGLYSPWNSPGENTGVGSYSLLQGIFPTSGSTPGLQNCRQILYQLSYKGCPRVLEWVAYLFPSRSSWLRNQTRVSCIAGVSLPTELWGKPDLYMSITGKFDINLQQMFRTN